MKQITSLSEKEQIDFLIVAKQAIESKEVRSLFHFCSLNGYDYYNVYARNRIHNVIHLTTENNGKFTTKQSKLTESDYDDILRMYNEGKTQREIGEFMVCRQLRFVTTFENTTSKLVTNRQSER